MIRNSNWNECIFCGFSNYFVLLCVNATDNVAQGKSDLDTLGSDLDLVPCIVSCIPFSWETFNWHYLCHSDSETAAASFCLHILLKGRLHWLFTALILLEGGWWPGPPRMEWQRGAWFFLETFRFTFPMYLNLKSMSICWKVLLTSVINIFQHSLWNTITAQWLDWTKHKAVRTLITNMTALRSFWGTW